MCFELWKKKVARLSERIRTTKRNDYFSDLTNKLFQQDVKIDIEFKDQTYTANITCPVCSETTSFKKCDIYFYNYYVLFLHFPYVITCFGRTKLLPTSPHGRFQFSWHMLYTKYYSWSGRKDHNNWF